MLRNYWGYILTRRGKLEILAEMERFMISQVGKSVVVINMMYLLKTKCGKQFLYYLTKSTY